MRLHADSIQLVALATQVTQKNSGPNLGGLLSLAHLLCTATISIKGIVSMHETKLLLLL